MNITDLHEYQVHSKDHILTNTHSALFQEMGLGKTVSTLTAINILIYEELEIDTVLVIAPKRVAENVWDQEGQKWDHLKHLRFSKICGSPAERKAAIKRKADVYLLGRDNVQWLCDMYNHKELPFDMLVIDELSSFKNPSSKRFRSLKKVQPFFSRVVGLTGTPAPNGLIDLWSQIYLLDRGERLGKFLSIYRKRYFTPAQTNGHIVYRYALTKTGEEEIHEAIGDICISMKAKDFLDLPERIENIVLVKLGQKIMEEYNEFEKEMVLDLMDDDGDISAVNAGVLMNKLLQFANGAIYDTERNVHHIHDAKIEALKELIDTASGPVLIGWAYQHDRDRMLEALKPYKPRQLNDGEDIKEWNEGQIEVMMMHPASGGHGLNLQAGGNTIIWFGQTWSLELYQQFNARLHRQGQKNAVVIHKIIAEDTVDMDVIKAQTRKATKQEGLMAAVKARIKKYNDR